jgi:hypothetical protein
MGASLATGARSKWALRAGTAASMVGSRCVHNTQPTVLFGCGPIGDPPTAGVSLVCAALLRLTGCRTRAFVRPARFLLRCSDSPLRCHPGPIRRSSDGLAPSGAAPRDCYRCRMQIRRIVHLVRGIWSGRPDLNRRPPVPQTGALPDCATPRREAESSRRADQPRRLALAAGRPVFLPIVTPPFVPALAPAPPARRLRGSSTELRSRKTSLIGVPSKP